MAIVNLTQHDATPEQIAAGVVDLPPAARRRLRAFLTFDVPPSPEHIAERAAAIAEMANGAEAAMLGGALFLMSATEGALRRRGIEPLYAFTRRESSQELLADGSVRKIQLFRHEGFVKPPP